MSSYIRRLEIRILKSRGYVRQTQKVVNGKLIPCLRVLTPEGLSLPYWPRP